MLLLLPLLWRARRTRWIAPLVAAFVVTAAVAQSRLDARWPVEAGQRDVAVIGWIDEFPTAAPERAAFSLRVVETAVPGVPERLRLSWYDPPQGLEAGATLELEARIRSPRGLANPGRFDYERWLFAERIGATGYVREGRVVTGDALALAQRWLRYRASLAARIEAAASSASGAALLVALTLGERRGFSDEHWTDLRRTGTSHLVAISGLHVGLVAALVFWLTRSACLRTIFAHRAYATAALASAVAAFAYAALAGFAVPTQRAVVMVVAALAIAASRRVTDPLDGIAAALLVVLAIDPLATLSVSFWLSFGAVAVLLLLATRGVLSAPAASRARAFARGIRTAAGLQLAITLALAPFVAAFFGELSISSPLVNFVAIPVFSFFMVPISLIAAASVTVGAQGLGLVEAAAAAADLAWRGLHAAAQWPWSTVALPLGGDWRTWVAGAAAVLAIPAHALPGRRLLWLALLPMIAARPPRPPPGEAQLLVLDVGHGLAALVQTATHDLLYDAGPVFRSGFDTGSEIVVPALARRGVDNLDLLVLSHADADHAGGAQSVLAAYADARVLKGPDVDAVDGEVCVAGKRWRWDGVTFEILHPAAAFADRGNESSCVMRVVARGGSILMTGDVEARGERALASRGDIAADVVLVPHHGSATSSSQPLVASVQAKLAIVSAAHDNRWDFPREEVVRRWRAAGAAMLVTADTGAITVRLRNGAPVVDTQRHSAKRYWHSDSTMLPGAGGTGAL